MAAEHVLSWFHWELHACSMGTNVPDLLQRLLSVDAARSHRQSVDE